MSNDYTSAIIFTGMNSFDGQTVESRFAGQSLPAGSVPVRVFQIQNRSWGTERVSLDLVWMEGPMKAAVDHETAIVMLSLYGQLTTEDIAFVALNAPECCLVANQWENHWSGWASQDGKAQLVERLVAAGADVNYVQNGKTILDILDDIVEGGGSCHDDEGSWPWEHYVIPAYQALGAKRAHELAPEVIAAFAAEDERRRTENEQREAAKAARRNNQPKGWRRVQRVEEPVVADEAVAEE